MPESEPSRYFEIHDRYKEWLQEHPVVIPGDVVVEAQAWQAIFDDPKIDREDWNKRFKEYQELMAKAESPEATPHDLYRRLHQLRKTFPSGNKGKIDELEKRLSDCYCGSGKKFADCHALQV